MKLQLMNMQVAVLPDKLPTHVGAIALPEAKAQRPMTGMILGRAEDAPQILEPGRRVVFSEFAGITTLVDGAEVKLIHPSEFLAWIPAGVNVEAP